MALRAWMLLCLVCLYVTMTSSMSSSVNISKKGAPPDIVGRRILQVEDRVVSALRKSGRYRVASSLLDAIDINQVLPATCTLLIPDDSAASQLQFQNFTTALPVLQYHVLTQLLSFPDLLKLPVGSSLSTMLSGRPVIVTNTSRRNFTLNDVRLSRPDIYLGDGLIVHGLEGILNFTDPFSSSHSPPPSSSSTSKPPSSTPKPPSSTPPTSPSPPPSTPSTPSTSPSPPPPPPPPPMSIFRSPPPPPSPPSGSPPSPPSPPPGSPPFFFPGISPPDSPPPPSPTTSPPPTTPSISPPDIIISVPTPSAAPIPPNTKMSMLCNDILLLCTIFLGL